jgi:hypothetical protein
MEPNWLPKTELAELADMAKKKTEQTTLVAIKGTDEYGAWLKRLADHVGLPVTHIIDLSVRQFAKRMKFEETPPKRLKR